MWPSQGYCTKVIFIDYSSVMRTHELTCTVFHVCFHLSINASDVLTSVKFSQLTWDFYSSYCSSLSSSEMRAGSP